MLSPDSHAFQQSLADLSAQVTRALAQASVCVNVLQAADKAPLVKSAAHQDHTPSPFGQRVVATALLPNFWVGCVGLDTGQHKIKIAANRGQDKTCCIGQASKSSEGSGTCLSKTSFLASSPVAALRPVVIPSANRPLAAVPSARAQQHLPEAPLFKGRPLVRQVTSPIASLTPANAAGTNTHTIHHRLNFRPRMAYRCASLVFGYSHNANRAAPADAVLRVSLKTQKDIPCSRKS